VPGSICLVALAALMPACSTDSFERVRKDVAHAAIALEREHDADSLAAAALLSGSFMFGKDPKRALSLIAGATAAAPAREDIAWLQAAICQQAPPCDAGPFEGRLRKLDPSNGAGWLGELDRAWAAQDTERTNEALRAIGQTDRVNLYYTTLIAKLTPKIAETGSIALDEATIAVTGALAGETVSSYPAVSQACKGERLMQADVPKLCQGVARAFENGDAVITEMVGVAIAKRVWSEDSPEWKAALDKRRVYEYQSKLLLEVDATPDATKINRYIALCGQYRREQDVFRAELVDAGKNPDPSGQ
jgi:hypothetical protein